MTVTLTILGGLGIFLLGMKLLSENLREAAGDALRLLLSRFTTGKISSVTTGTIFTALVQSSSATTLASIGFVSAGLLTFSQAVGVIFGANLGTTSTSWLVATLGLNVSISSFAYPMVGLGALASLFLRGRSALFGAAVAGFGLIFVGIDVLQVGMGDLADQIDLTAIDAYGLRGQLLLVGVGFIMTVLMQSSSAAIASTITALFAGAVDFPQAAALVIGQALGTTSTAVIAAIGASVAARRTAAAHIVFNLITSLIALAFLPLFLFLYDSFFPSLNAAVALALFHTSFKILGVAVLLPFLEPFSRIVDAVVPGEAPQYAAGLDDNASTIAPVAMEAAHRAQLQMYEGMHRYMTHRLQNPDATDPIPQELDALAVGLARCRDFLEHIHPDPDSESEHQRYLAILHTMDHLERLSRRLELAKDFYAHISSEPSLERARAILERTLERAQEVAPESHVARSLADHAEALSEERKHRRHLLLKKSATGDPGPRRLDRLIRTLTWADRIAFHLWRAAFYLEGGRFDPQDIPEEYLD